VFRDVEKEQRRLSEALLEEQREEQAQQYLDEDDDSFPQEVDHYQNYANGYDVPREKGVGGLVALACILAGSILLIVLYWVLRLTGVLA